MYRKRNLLGIESQLSERGNYIGIQENSDGAGIHVFIIQYNNGGSVDVSQCTSNPSHGKENKEAPGYSETIHYDNTKEFYDDEWGKREYYNLNNSKGSAK